MSIYTSTAMRKPRRGEKCPTCGRRVPKPIKSVRANPRKGPMRDPGYRKYVRISPCIVCSNGCGECHHINPWPECCLGRGECVGVPVDAAHTENNGMGSKGPDSSCVPLCRKHHQEQHKIGIDAFNKKYGINLKEIAAEHYSRYLSEKEQQSK